MARDASLDDFAVGSDEASDETRDAAGSDETRDAAGSDETRDAAGGDEPVDEGIASDGAADAAEEGEPTTTDEPDGVAFEDPSTVEPAVATSTLSSDGVACASCGASTRRLWTAEGDAVCADCKSW